MFLVDSHCHLDSLDFTKSQTSIDQILANAQNQDVKYCLSVATTLSGYQHLSERLSSYDNIAFSCGLHPLHIDEAPFTTTDLIELARSPRVIALGETGLDYYYRQDNAGQQRELFSQHIQVGRELNKPVIVHTRQAKDDTLAVLHEEHAEQCGGVLHCFTEDIDMAKKLLDIGFFISFSGIITFKNAASLREVARYVPLERMLIETDSPYLAPVPYRGKENQPAFVREVAKYLAELKNVPLEEFARITTGNFSRLFNVMINNGET